MHLIRLVNSMSHINKKVMFCRIQLVRQHFSDVYPVMLYTPVMCSTDLKPRPKRPTFIGSFSLMLSCNMRMPFQSSLLKMASLYVYMAGPCYHNTKYGLMIIKNIST